jgi:hypothetical protein
VSKVSRSASPGGFSLTGDFDRRASCEGREADCIDDEDAQRVAGARTGDAGPGEQPEHDLAQALSVGAARALSGQIQRNQVRVDKKNFVRRGHQRAQAGTRIPDVGSGRLDLGQDAVRHHFSEEIV